MLITKRPSHIPFPEDCGHGMLRWHKADAEDGPLKDGWSIYVGDRRGYPQFENVDFCPDCGFQVTWLIPKEK